MKRTAQILASGIILALLLTLGAAPAYAQSNALTDEQYAAFGLSPTTPDLFTDETDPLADYKPIIMNELYLGVMNQSGHYNGSFKVMDNTSETSSSAFGIKNMSKNLIGEETALDNYDKRFQTQNACAADIDGDGSDEIAEIALYTSGDQDYACLSVYDLVDGAWMKTVLATYPLTDSGASYIQDIDANTSKGYVGLATGDYDGDGHDEIACYVAAKTDDGPFVCEFDPDTGAEKRLLLASMDTRFDVTSSNWTLGKLYMPVVSLTTTSISGQDDLVVNVCNPLKSGVDQRAVLIIYRLDGQLPTQMYWDLTMTPSGASSSDNHRMRFCSSVDADLLGNGSDVLVVGGYQNYDYANSTDAGKLSSTNNMIQLFVWDDSDYGNYKRVWGQPFDGEIAYGSMLATDTAMMEPAAMAAGRLNAASTADRVFLEGSILRFVPSKSTASTDLEILKDGSFAVQDRIALKGDNNAFISQAAIAHFSSADTTTEQLVVLSGDQNTFSGINDKIYYDMSWSWEENGQFKCTVTDNDFIESDQDDNGTYTSICALNADQDTMYLKYEGRDMGWSEPELYCVLQSPPYWRELLYESGTGSVSFEVTSGHSDGVDWNANIGVGGYLHVQALVGAGLLGNDAKAGGGAELSVLLAYVHDHTESHTEESAWCAVVSPGQDHVVVFAVPVVTYHYSLYLPEHTMGQDELDVYNELKTESDPSYRVGDTVPGGWYPVPVVSVGNPCMSHLTLSDYNKLVDQMGSETQLPKIGDELLPAKTSGDPSTYPSDEADLTVRGNVKNLAISPTGAQVSAGDGETWLTFTLTDEEGHDNGFNIEVDGSLFLAAEGEVSAIIAAETSTEVGVKGHLEGGAVWTESDTDGSSFSTVFADLPKGTSSAYDFVSNMAVYQLDLEDADDPYCIAYTASTSSDVPPVLPMQLRVYGTTSDEVVLCWEKVEGARAAQSWEVFIRDKNGMEHSLGVTNDTYYEATYLDPDTTYEFSLKAYSDKDGKGRSSSQSAWVSATTKEDSEAAPCFTMPPENVTVTVGSKDVQTMHVEAEMGTGMEEQGATLSYQWQRYSSDSLSFEGTWVDIEGANGTDLELPTLTSAGDGQYLGSDGATYAQSTYYRVVATQRLGANIRSIISRNAAMIALEDNDAATGTAAVKTTLTLQVAPDQEGVRTLKSVCLFNPDACESLLLEGQLADSQGQGLAGKRVLLMKRGDTGDQMLLAEATDDRGVVSFAVPTASLDRSCQMYALFEGELTEGGEPVVQLSAQSQEDELQEEVTLVAQADDGQTPQLLPSQSDDVTVHAVTHRPVVYELEGGVNNAANPSVITSMSDVTKLKAATRRGYTFTGWQNSKGEQVTQVSGTDADTSEPLVLTATYTADQYPITYELDGGTNAASNPSSYTTEDAVKLQPATKDGYSFAGWYLDAAHTEPTSGVPLNSVGPITFYAAWEAAPVDPDKPSEDQKEADNKDAGGSTSGSGEKDGGAKGSLAKTGDVAWPTACASLAVCGFALIAASRLSKNRRR